MERECEGERGKTAKRTTQARVEAVQQQLRCFWMGFPSNSGHHFFLSLSLFVLFRCVTSYFIPMCNSEPAFAPLFVFFSLKGKTCRKAWCCTCERDFWQSCTPTNRNILAHLWIFIFLFSWCSGTYCYVILRVVCVWPISCVSWCFVYPLCWQRSHCWFFFPLLVFSRSLCLTKAIL